MSKFEHASSVPKRLARLLYTVAAGLKRAMASSGGPSASLRTAPKSRAFSAINFGG
jgi:hypothetical protein